MANFFKALSALANLFPALLALIKSLEAEMPSGSGAQKKAAVMEFLTKLLASAGSYVKEITPDLAAQIVQAADHLVDAVIAALNIAGIFKKTTPAS